MCRGCRPEVITLCAMTVSEAMYPRYASGKLVPLPRSLRKFGMANWSAYWGSIWSKRTTSTRSAGRAAGGLGTAGAAPFAVPVISRAPVRAVAVRAARDRGFFIGCSFPGRSASPPHLRLWCVLGEGVNGSQGPLTSHGWVLRTARSDHGQALWGRARPRELTDRPAAASLTATARDAAAAGRTR